MHGWNAERHLKATVEYENGNGPFDPFYAAVLGKKSEEKIKEHLEAIEEGASNSVQKKALVDETLKSEEAKKAKVGELVAKVLNKPLVNGETALHISAFYSNPEVVKLLLQYQANPDLKDDNEKTPIFSTIDGMKFFHEKCEKMILEGKMSSEEYNKIKFGIAVQGLAIVNMFLWNSVSKASLISPDGRSIPEHILAANIPGIDLKLIDKEIPMLKIISEVEKIGEEGVKKKLGVLAKELEEKDILLDALDKHPDSAKAKEAIGLLNEMSTEEGLIKHTANPYTAIQYAKVMVSKFKGVDDKKANEYQETIQENLDRINRYMTSAVKMRKVKHLYGNKLSIEETQKLNKQEISSPEHTQEAQTRQTQKSDKFSKHSSHQETLKAKPNKSKCMIM